MTEEQKQKWREIGRRLKPIAPVIAGSLLGPWGAAAVEATQAVGKIFKKEDPGEILPDISSLTPETAARIREAEAEVAMKKIEAEMNLDDNVTARWTSDNATNSRFVQLTRPLQAWVWTAFSFLVCLLSLFGIAGISEAIASVVLNFVQIIMITIIGAYFGSRGVEKVTAIAGNRWGIVGEAMARWQERRKQK